MLLFLLFLFSLLLRSLPFVNKPQFLYLLFLIHTNSIHNLPTYINVTNICRVIWSNFIIVHYFYQHLCVARNMLALVQKYSLYEVVKINSHVSLVLVNISDHDKANFCVMAPACWIWSQVWIHITRCQNNCTSSRIWDTSSVRGSRPCMTNCRETEAKGVIFKMAYILEGFQSEFWAIKAGQDKTFMGWRRLTRVISG